MGVITQFQLDTMMVMAHLCGMTAIFSFFAKSLSSRRRMILILMQLGAMCLVTFDRWTYIYDGNQTQTGYIMVRISNFIVFSMILFVIFIFNEYVAELYTHEGHMKREPKTLTVCRVLTIMGQMLIIISQFTGLYYVFDESNLYHRQPAYIVSYVFPFVSLLLLFITLIRYRKLLGKGLQISLLLFTFMPFFAAVIQFFFYGISLTNIFVVANVILIYIYSIFDMNDTVDRARRTEIEYLQKEQTSIQNLFEQTAEALAGAIDAKDPYTHGHSIRVAEYSKKIAEMSGFDEKECRDIYYAALLHDVGKIGVPDWIIQKDGKLTDEEFGAIKRHPSIGGDILLQINKLPYLSIGARYHHERFDGRGYPEGLQGEEIPEIARIVAVADAYDAMTSKRSYRDPIPQQTVREEVVKGMGTQFDPKYAKAMLHLIDMDEEYEMQDRGEVDETEGNEQVVCEELRSAVSIGIWINEYPTTISFQTKANGDYSYEECLPTVLMFDSTSGGYGKTEQDRKYDEYCEYGWVRMDGEYSIEGFRKADVRVTKSENMTPGSIATLNRNGMKHTIEAVKVEDHLRLKITDECQVVDATLALPDSTRFVYVAFTGEHCIINGISTIKAVEAVGADYIPRIVDKISFIDGPEGDLPNIQIDGWRTAVSESVLLKEHMTIRFHSLSLPTARLVWHCPYICIFSSDDGTIHGDNYREYAMIRLDGESWEASDYSDNVITVYKSEEFGDWNTWKARNKEGVDCKIELTRKKLTIHAKTSDAGLHADNITYLHEELEHLYVMLTGDQCAITDIHIQ